MRRGFGWMACAAVLTLSAGCGGASGVITRSQDPTSTSNTGSEVAAETTLRPDTTVIPETTVVPETTTPNPDEACIVAMRTPDVYAPFQACTPEQYDRLVPTEGLGKPERRAACQFAPMGLACGDISVTTTTAAPTVIEQGSGDAAPVTRVVDGDTVGVAGGDRVRLIGIDTPERDRCGFEESKRRVEQLVASGTTALAPAPGREDRDRYGRLLRYLLVDGRDVGTVLLSEGLAHARYDSLDGYGFHPRQDEYRRIDAETPNLCATSPPSTQSAPPSGPGAGVYYSSCAEARRAGVAPIYAGQPGYRPGMDGDGDGIACEVPR